MLSALSKRFGIDVIRLEPVKPGSGDRYDEEFNNVKLDIPVKYNFSGSR